MNLEAKGNVAGEPDTMLKFKGQKVMSMWLGEIHMLLILSRLMLYGLMGWIWEVVAKGNSLVIGPMKWMKDENRQCPKKIGYVFH